MNNSYALYAQRRQHLVALIKKEMPAARGPIVLFSRFESERTRFRQDSSFYYFTGIEEPGAVLAIELDGRTVLYVPDYTQGNRGQWMDQSITADAQQAAKFGISEIVYTGAPVRGYQVSELFSVADYEHLIKRIQATEKILVCAPVPGDAYRDQLYFINRLQQLAQGKFPQCEDISLYVGRLRRVKARDEVELIYKAVELTMIAHEAAARSVSENMRESQIQAGIEYVFTESGGRPAFPSIVGSGRNSIILHYQRNNKVMRNGELVVVDIGAEVNYYCADLTRTYPVSGEFNRRQKEVYTAVLETQDFIASKARPGLWLSNKDKPQESLQHMALEFLQKKGFAQYFVHGIGHYLGMDVHDVGSGAEPLVEGDVITIEPGVYIAAEQLGVRIEDNYWVVAGGVECLSEALPKSIIAIEELAQSSIDDEYEGEVGDSYDDEGDYQ